MKFLEQLFSAWDPVKWFAALWKFGKVPESEHVGNAKHNFISSHYLFLDANSFWFFCWFYLDNNGIRSLIFCLNTAHF